MSQIRTQLCYSLDEAAQALNLSETVLVRLSQYFKVPASAYEEVGYLSFKGDLVFSEPDLTFFRKVKECLVTGDTLEQARQKVHYGPPQSTVASRPNATSSAPSGSTLREVQDSTPYQKAAERDFARYKNAHHAGISRVFEKMVKEVSAPPSKKASLPDAKPMRNKMDKEALFQPERLLPFVRNPKWHDAPGKNNGKVMHPRTLGQVSAWTPAAEKEMGWEHLIQEAVQQPRVLNQHLKSAALALKEQAIHRHRQTRP